MKRKQLERIARLYRNRVRECRLQAMLPKQEDLVKLTGISRSVISALENNRVFLSSPYAITIAEALGCKLDDLFEKRQLTTTGHKEEKSNV